MRIMDKLQAMRIFVKVAESKSFTKTALLVGLPKASISHYIQSLESDLGVRLFNRTTRQVNLTLDGTVYLERCIEILNGHEEIDNLFKKSAQKISGVVKIDMPIGFSKNVFIPKLKNFLDTYPELEIELSTTDRKVDVVAEGFDIVLRVGSLNDSSLIARKVGELKIKNCASREYVKKYGLPKKLEDLKHHKLISYSPNLNRNSDGFEYFDGSKYRTIKMKGNLVVNSSETYSSACLLGLGIIQAPEIGVNAALKAGKLVEILPKYEAEPMTVSLLYPQRKIIPLRTQICLDWLTELLSDYVK